MDITEYTKFFMKAKELQKQSSNVFDEQVKLSDDCKMKMEKFYEIEDEICSLYIEGTKKMKEKWPENCSPISDVRFDNLVDLTKKYIENGTDMKELLERINSIPELKKAGELEQKRSELFYEYAMANLKLDHYINENKRKLFTKEYLDKMDEYANDGIMLYFLETPDIPILDPEVDEKMFLDSLLFEDCMSLKTLYKSYILCPSPGVSMQRKIEDVIDVINNLINGCYRTAARTIFALLESEIKNISKALEGFFKKEKQYKNGKQRSMKIEELTKYMDMPDAVKHWKKLNSYYAKIVTSDDADIDRNKIIHGDYNDDALDIDEYDVLKLMLLYLSIRIHGDYIQNHVLIYENVITYIFTNIAKKLKK